MFGTKGHDESVSKSKYIKPGVQEVIIDSIKGVDETKSYLEFTFRLPDSTAEEGNRQRFYMHTSGSAALNTSRIKHIATKVVKEKEIDAISADNILDYGLQLNKLMAGKSLRIKFCAEEYIKADGSVGVRSVLPVQNFAEATMPGAEYPVITKDMTRLKYDETNLYDYKKIVEAPKTNATIVEDDLPF